MGLAIPGAFVIWLFNRKKRSFSDILHEDPYLNYMFGVLSLLFLIIFAVIINTVLFSP
jgi:hypothetical protein